MEFKNTRVDGFEAAFRGARNPLNSWAKSDSVFALTSVDWLQGKINQVAATYPKSLNTDFDPFEFLEDNGIIREDVETDTYDIALIGHNDLSLAQRLLKAGTSDAKFMRQINVSVDITAPVFWLSQLDTYKISTTRNSTSLQHKGMSRDYTTDDFTIDDIQLVYFESGKETSSKEDLQIIIDLINKYRQLYKQTKDYRYFRIMRQLMPMGYNYTITWTSNYAGLRNMYFQRRNHQLTEWKKDFCTWVESLPYGKDLITYTG